MDVTMDQVVEWIIAIMPSVIAILSFVAMTIKTLKEFKSSKLELFSFKDLTETKKQLEEITLQMRQVIQENYELKKYTKELLTKIDRIQRK